MDEPTNAAPFNPPVIVDQHGRPARRAVETACPTCAAGVDKRVASGGFGERSTICGACGYDFQEVWRG